MNINKLSIALNFFKFIFLNFALLGASSALANDLYNIKPYIDISTQSTAKTTWLPPLANTTRHNELFFVNTRGDIYRAKGKEISQSPVLSLSQHIKNKESVIFTALTLHPSFHLRDQEGSNVIYTAHIEEFDSSIKKVRLDNDDIKQHHSHDAVITEWQLSNINNNITTYKQREILRIATPSVDVNINQLSFDPYLKPWSDDFGLLYISFKSGEKLKHSTLYSGSILRINPNKFGLKNYTIPLTNPFIKDPKIQDEMIILGIQQVQQFTWSKKARNQLILTHQYNDNQLISKSNIGSNYLLTKPLDTIYQQKAQSNLLSAAYYRGRELNTLWNKILFLEKNEAKWQLSATNISKNINNKELALSLSQIDESNQLALYITRENEVLLWDKTQAIIYKVSLNSVVDKEQGATAKAAQSSSSNVLLYSLLLLFILIVLYLKKQYNLTFIKNKSLLKATFARFHFDTTKNEVTLFKRHETQANIAISVSDLLSSEVYLNNTLINTVMAGIDNEFNVQKESSLRLSFEQEHRDKMVDDKVRQITLKITTVKAEKHDISVYLREGNQRFTKEKYHDVVEQLIDWHWYFSSIISPERTTERPIKKVKKKQHSAAVTSEVTKKTDRSNENPDLKPNTQPSAKVVTQINKDEAPKSKNQIPKVKVDTQLIEALNKLVTLREQGYLTEEEFSLAKGNLLNSLSDND